MKHVPKVVYIHLYSPTHSDVNKDWTCKDKDKDQAYKDQDKDKDLTHTHILGQRLHLLQVAAKPTISIKQQQWTQSESSQHMTVKPITLSK